MAPVILKEGEKALWAAVEVVLRGGVILYPTDTVYGLGGDATNEEVVKRIHTIKRSSEDKPLSIILPDLSFVDEWCETGVFEDIVMKKYLPGPYTFIVKKRRNIFLPASPYDTIGVRIPDHSFCLLLALKAGRPIISTSANFSGFPPPSSFEEVDKRLVEQVDLAVDGGPTKYRAPSTIVDLVHKKIIRGKLEFDLI